MAEGPAQAALAQEIATIKKSFFLAEKTCTAPWVLSFSTTLPGVSIKLHELLTILTAVALIINTLIALYLVWGHCFHWTKPMKQKQIIRILLFIPFLSTCCFVAIWSYPASGYIVPIGQYYEGFAITCFFLLYVQLVTPDHRTRASYFHHLERRWLNGSKKGEKGSLRWFRVIWIMVFQITISRIATVAASETLWATTCPLALARKWGQVVIIVVQSVTTYIAVWGVISFERRMSHELKEHKGTFKLLSFKVVVPLDATQRIIFSILGQYRVFFPEEPYRVSYNDFTIGLPNFCFVWELTVVAILFLWSFSIDEYVHQVRSGTPVEASAGRAFLQSLNTLDIFKGLAYSFTGWHHEPRNSFKDASTIEAKEPALSDLQQGNGVVIQDTNAIVGKVNGDRR